MPLDTDYTIYYSICMVNIKHRGFLPRHQREAVAQLQKLLREQGLLRASYVHISRRCGRDYCRCMRSKRNWHGSHYIVQRHKGKPRLQHVSKSMESAVQRWIDSYQHAKKLMDIISDIYWDKLKKRD